MSKDRATVDWTRKCYGVDLRENDCVVVLAERQLNGQLSYTTISPDDPVFANELRDGAASVGSLTARASFSRWLEAPFSVESKARKVLPTLLDIQLPFALEDCVYSFVDLHAGAGRDKVTRALAVAARHADVEKRISEYRAKGVDPFALDQEGVALWTQSLLELPVPQEGAQLPRVVVCLGQERTTLVIGRGEEFISSHNVRSNDTAQMARLLKTHLGSSSESGGMIQWAWTGPSASDHKKIGDLSEKLFKDWPGASFIHDDNNTFLARALVTRALVSGQLRCNLRSGKIIHPSVARKNKKALMTSAVLSLVAGLLLCISNLVATSVINHRKNDLNKSVSSLVDELAGYKVTAKGVAAVNTARDSMNLTIATHRVFNKAFMPSLSGVMKTVAEVGADNGLQFEMMSVDHDKVMISGSAVDWNSCDVLAAALIKHGYDLSLDRKDAMINERVPFTIMTGGNE